MRRCTSTVDQLYPGSDTGDQNSGLIVDSDTGEITRAIPVDRLASYSNTDVSDGIDVIAAYIVPPVSGGQLAVSAQRILQLERAVQMIFDLGNSATAPLRAGLTSLPNFNSSPFPVCVSGGSNGGHVTQALVTHFPHRVHGGVGVQYSPDSRTLVAEQALLPYVTGLQGFTQASELNGPWYTLPYAGFYNLLGFDYSTGSYWPAWNAGETHRPLYMILSDEDATWTGDTILPKIHGVDGYVEAGSVSPHPISGTPSAVSSAFHWSICDRICHDARHPFVIPFEVLLRRDGLTDQLPLAAQTEVMFGILPFLDEVAYSFDNPPAGLGMPNKSDIVAQSPPRDRFAHALQRPSTHERRVALAQRSPAAPQGLLAERHGFHQKQRGLGLWTGSTETLVSAGDRTVFVGSSDGVVTELTRLGNDLEFTITGRCRFDPADDAAQGPFSLGYRICALAVSDEWLAVATYSRLYIFNRFDLSQPAEWIELPFEEQRPVAMQIVDLFGDETLHVVYQSFLGELVARELQSGGLPTRAQLSEPSILDFVVSTEGSSGTWSRPIYIATVRGPILQIELDSSSATPSPARVSAVSAPLPRVHDLIWSADSGRLVALVPPSEEPELPRLLEFDPAVGLRLDVDEVTPLPGFGSAFAPEVRAWGQITELGSGQYAVVFGGALFYLANSIGFAQFKLDPVQQFTEIVPSMLYPLAVTAVDMDDDGVRDVVLATENGQVAWIERDVFTTSLGLTPVSSTMLGGTFPLTNPAAAQPFAYSAGSVSGTWAMTSYIKDVAGVPKLMLRLMDQSARVFEIDPREGNPAVEGALVYDDVVRVTLGQGVVAAQAIAAKPFRDLVEVGLDAVPPNSGTGFTRNWMSGVPDRHSLQTPFDVSVVPNSDYALSADAGPPGWIVFDRANHFQIYDRGFLPLSFGGDRIIEPQSGGLPPTQRVYWWAGSPPFGLVIGKDVVRGVVHADPQLGPPFFGVWGSSTSLTSVGTNFQAHFRNTLETIDSHDMQSLRAGKFMSGNAIRLILSTQGGGLMAVDPSQHPSTCLVADPAPAQADHGWGGIALCVQPVRNAGGDPTIFSGTLFAREDPLRSDGRAFASLHICELINDQIIQTSSLRFDGDQGSNRPELFGLCGIATGNLVDDSSNDGVEAELVLTTLNGDLVVYELESAGSNVVLGEFLYWNVFDGALGANNSIFIDDMATPRAVFVAGSMGMRKLFVQGGL